ncbi:hypothetical protein SAMN05216264_11966 [Pseudomonas marincola]|nr:hypothetical protein SAMN05216264_11966 [Pseudomonas marincola]
MFDVNGELIPWSGISYEVEGVIKGVTITYEDDQPVLYYVDSDGNLSKILVATVLDTARQSWREVRPL